MSNILRQHVTIEDLTRGQRFAMFVSDMREISEQFYNRIARVDSTHADFHKYAFLLFMKEHIESLDKSSQIIFYHVMKNIDAEATAVVTSLSQENIDQILLFMRKNCLARLETFDYESPAKNFWELKAFIDDLVYSYDKSDAQIVQIYNEDVAVVKILRHLSKMVFNK